jgi:predicted kinase
VDENKKLAYNRAMRKLILIRAVSGAGKSTFAKIFAPDSCICCADDFFTDEEGNYNFDASKLGQAHKACQDKYLELLDSPFADTIVVSNTNTKESDYKFYLDEAEKRGIMVFSLVLENRHGNKNIHNVPDHVLERQEQNIKNSLKLR